MALPTASACRIELRPLTEDEARAVLRNRRQPHWSAGYPTEGDRDISRFLTDRPPPNGCSVVFRPFQIVVADSGTVVGGIGCHRPPDRDRRVEIGYGIAPEWRNQGLTTEAVRTLVRWLAAEDVRTVTARTAPDNLASQAVLRHIGFTEEGMGPDGFLLWELALR